MRNSIIACGNTPTCLIAYLQNGAYRFRSCVWRQCARALDAEHHLRDAQQLADCQLTAVEDANRRARSFSHCPPMR